MENNDDGDDKKISTTLGIGNLSLSIPPGPGPSNESSRDLLRMFKGIGGESETLMHKDEGIELNLGLSLGGRFGMDKSSSKLKRSSSIASCLPLVTARDDNSGPGLVRTSSLPLEVEEDWRKRKEWQSLRRMEAKRRRSEKQRNSNSKADKEIEVNLKDRLETGRNLGAVKGLGLVSSSMDSGGGILDVNMVKGKGTCIGSVESMGASLESRCSKTPQGSNNEQQQSNPVSISSCSKTRENTGIKAGSQSESPSKKSSTPITQGRKTTTNSFGDMPCVFTMGDGPNGRRVDGILYKYGKGQEVRIMCVCHGSFHSPAEFIRHAGGTDVDHPLKHIVVNPNAASLL